MPNPEREWITCTMCGEQIDPQDAAAQPACQACPLQTGRAPCALLRCPVCGFETINPQRSMLGRWFLRLFPGAQVSSQR